MQKIRRYILGITLSLLAGAICSYIHNSSSDSGDERVYTQCEMESQYIDDTLDSADVILRGTIQNITEKQEYDEYVVKPTSVIKGENAKAITIQNNLYQYSYQRDEKSYTGTTHTEYKKGEEYLFVLQHIYNVYGDRYVIMADAFIPLNDKKEISIVSEYDNNIKDVAAYIENYTYKKKGGAGDKLSIDYTKSDKLSDITASSEYIAIVTPDEKYQSTEMVDLYLCTVKSKMKGEIAFDQILIPFFPDTVKEGEDIIVLLDQTDSESNMFTLSSKKSVYPVEQKELIKNQMR